MKHHSDKIISLKQSHQRYIDVDTLLKEINNSLMMTYLRQSMRMLIQILRACYIITFNVWQQMTQTVGCMMQSNI